MAVTSDSPRGIIPARAGFTGSFRLGWMGWRDHPRSRGVYAGGGAEGAHVFGSSPLARGLPGPQEGPGEDFRIIPASAGFTLHWVERGCVEADHPRSRGVYLIARAENKQRQGSSPLARGLRGSRLGPPSCGRIIPARAGFTAWPISGCMTMWGSSPLARGLRRRRVGQFFWDRIIPARAGFTSSPPSTSSTPSDHPRSRGVYSPAYALSPIASGSSPLARGLPNLVTPMFWKTGIIPARAGFTVVSPVW